MKKRVRDVVPFNGEPKYILCVYICCICWILRLLGRCYEGQGRFSCPVCGGRGLISRLTPFRCPDDRRLPKFVQCDLFPCLCEVEIVCTSFRCFLVSKPS